MVAISCERVDVGVLEILIVDVMIKVPHLGRNILALGHRQHLHTLSGASIETLLRALVYDLALLTRMYGSILELLKYHPSLLTFVCAHSWSPP